MVVNICGDFTTIGRGEKAIDDRIALDSKILDLFTKSDLNIVNLESPVASDLKKGIKKSGPNIHTNSKAIEYLASCNVGLVTLANNHFYDYGRHGIEATVGALRKHCIDYVGGGLTSEDVSRIFYFEKNGINIAILNYCESEFSITEGEGSNPINPIHVHKDLQEAKKISDFRIVITHGGHEGYNLPSPRMKELYRFFIDSGANIVCNHHQHCFSGIENYGGGTIFYGIGNFFFDDFRPVKKRSNIWNSGYIVSLTIDKKGNAYSIYPYFQCRQIPTTILMEGQEKKEFEKELRRLNDIISDDIELRRSFDNWCSKKVPIMLPWLSPYSNRLSMALCRRGLLPKFLSDKKKLQLYNAIRCESLRDVILNILKYK